MAAVLAEGEGSGPVLVLREALSFWGGVDPATGRIVDVHHPDLGATVTGAVLAMPGGRGSSSSSSILAEAIRLGTAPAAIVLAEPDPILGLGSIVARELYGLAVPVVAVEAALFRSLRPGEVVEVEARRTGSPSVRVVRTAGDQPSAS
jgi:predicted aconitase with swiveling domain